jgi:hypothetical protein
LLAEPELPAQITHIMLGTNDSYGFFEWFPDGTHGNWLTPGEYEERLRILIERSPGFIFVSSPPPLAETITGPVTERLSAYRDVVLSVVADYRRVELGVDFHELLDRRTDMDGCHPNTDAHVIMADALEKRVLLNLPIRSLSRYKRHKHYRRGRDHKRRKRFTLKALRPRNPNKHIANDPEHTGMSSIPSLALEDIGTACEAFPQAD